MEVSKSFSAARIEEIKILKDIRLIYNHDLNPVYSKDNLRVQFSISGELRGSVTCYLCLDDHELIPSEKNFIFPLFVESMNILVGRQISLDEDLSRYKIKISAPKLSMISNEINTSFKASMQKYELELENSTFQILTEYTLEAIN